jgi:two-component system chemotaxis sensor kinase CheA
MTHPWPDAADERLMTNELTEIIQRCAVSVKRTRPGDLLGIAQLHSDLQAVRMLSSNGASPLKDVPEVAQRAADLLEKLVMNESEDATTALAEAGRQITELQALFVEQTSVEKARAASPAPVEEPPSPELPTAIEHDRVIVETDAALALEFVSEALGHLDSAEAGLLTLEQNPSNAGELNDVFRAFHTIKGIAGFLEFKQIGTLAHATENLLEMARKGRLLLSGSQVDLILEACDMVKQMTRAVEVAARTLGALPPQGGLDSLLQRLRDSVGQIQKKAPSKTAVAPEIASPEIEPKKISPPDISTKAPNAAPALPIPAASAHPAPVVQSPGSITTGEGVVRVSTLRLDALVDAVGELVIAQAMVAQDLGSEFLSGNQRLSRNLSQLGKIARGLQDLSMSMRMLPIAAVFQKMARLARDLSHKAGKELNFVKLGEETELDRNVVEAISDPLIHMVRNAIDHGLESAEQRVSAGKPREGTLTLRAAHRGGYVLIEVSDDGHGLDQQKILQKAHAAGLVQPGQELTEQQIFQLIFHPGLSTAPAVTELSGRGVGMDVVRKNVEALRGRIEIASTEGVGTTFTIRLPLTLAIIDGLVVKVGDQRYIIPITSIEQSIRPTAKQLSTVRNRGELCLVRGALLPIVRLHRIFGLQPRTEDPTAALVVIVQEGERRCCLLVDELIGQHQVVIKSIGKEIGDLPSIAGCAILGDGNVSLILDIAGLIDSAFGEGTHS